MKKKIFLFSTVIVLYSCSSIKSVSGKKFVYESLNRELILSFDNDSLCTLKNVFYCDDIDKKYREITIKATYKKNGDIIILKNIDCKENSCVLPPIVEIPTQASNKCNFLSSESRESKKIFDGRTYQSEYLKYGVVPNIDNDTLYIYKKQITLVKKFERGSLGFIFK